MQRLQCRVRVCRCRFVSDSIRGEEWKSLSWKAVHPRIQITHFTDRDAACIHSLPLRYVLSRKWRRRKVSGDVSDQTCCHSEQFLYLLLKWFSCWLFGESIIRSVRDHEIRKAATTCTKVEPQQVLTHWQSDSWPPLSSAFSRRISLTPSMYCSSGPIFRSAYAFSPATHSNYQVSP